MVDYGEPHNKDTGKDSVSSRERENAFTFYGSVVVGFGHTEVKRCFRRRNHISKAQGIARTRRELRGRKEF